LESKVSRSTPLIRNMRILRLSWKEPNATEVRRFLMLASYFRCEHLAVCSQIDMGAAL
jgi:hypothetical protein